MGNRQALAPILVFFALFTPLTAFFGWRVLAAGTNGYWTYGLMWSVGLSAILAVLITRGRLGELGWGWGPWRCHLIALVLPLAYAGLAYGLAGATGLAAFPAAGRFPALIRSYGVEGGLSVAEMVGVSALLTIIGLLQSMLSATGEEIGWRGFLNPRLEGLLGFVGGALVTGVVWAGWHTPIVILGDYNSGGLPAFEVAAFVVMAVAMSGPMAWLRRASNSLWPCAVLHASHNLFIQFWFDGLTARGSGEVTMVGEFGVLMAASTLLVSLPFWISGARSPKENA